MKKKVAILSLGLLLIASGVVSAATMWGTYKGYDIIRLQVGGNTIQATDVPAINFNNRTMIPIYMLKDAGINYTWDQDNKTVKIEPSSVDVSAVKGMFRTVEHFDTLQYIGEKIANYYWTLSTTYQYIDAVNASSSLNFAFDEYNELVNEYNSILDSSNNFVSIASQNGIDLSITNSIFDNYYEMLEYLGTGLERLDAYNNTKNTTDLDEYFTATNNYLKIATIGTTKAHDQKYYYYNKAINY